MKNVVIFLTTVSFFSFVLHGMERSRLKNLDVAMKKLAEGSASTAPRPQPIAVPSQQPVPAPKPPIVMPVQRTVDVPRQHQLSAPKPPIVSTAPRIVDVSRPESMPVHDQIYAAPRAHPAPAPKQQQAGAMSAEVEMFLSVHNQCRAELGVGPLVWDEGLAQYASQWAQELARTDSFKHRPNNRFGENLFWGSGASYNFADAARAWAAEKPFMKGKQYSPEAGHYSQMIWKNTKRVGAAAVRYGNKIVIVANYDPAGNYIGQDAY